MGRSRVLAALTWGYLGWSLLPVVVAIAASLGRGPLSDAGWSLEAYRDVLRVAELRGTFLHSLALAAVTVLVAVPLGTALGLALAHLDGRAWRIVGGALLAGIALPHVALAVVLTYLVLFVTPFHLDMPAQIVGHITLALPFVAVVVWTRVRLLDRSYAEQAADLGAPPSSAVIRVLLPLCLPSIVVATVVAFTVSFNELPVSQYLCTPPECRTVPMALGGQVLGDVPPTSFALGMIATLVSIASLGVLVPVLRSGRRAT